MGSLGVRAISRHPDGTLELTEIGKLHNMDHGVPRWYNKNVVNPFGDLPGVKEAEDHQ